MLLLKIYYHLWAIIGRCFYRLIYPKSLKMGRSISWRKSFRILISKNAQVVIGNQCFFNNYCSITVHHQVRIGNHSIFGEGVKIYDHNHRFNLSNKLIADQGYSDGSVIIGDNCWIGSNVTILKGAQIGDNTVIGAGAVISGNIPANSIVKRNDNYIIEPIKYRNNN